MQISKRFNVEPSQLERARKALEDFLHQPTSGFSDLPFRSDSWSSTQKLADKLKGKYQHHVLVGVGGSSAGSQVIIDVFKLRNFSVLDNVDSQHFDTFMQTLPGLEKVLWIFVSKTGTTIETLVVLDTVTQIYADKGLNLTKNSVVITEENGGSLDKWAKIHNVPTLTAPQDIGGRFSVLSPVGMFVPALAGLNLDQFRSGAIRAHEDRETVIEVTAQYLQSFERQEWITLFWFYTSQLKSFGVWLQQLWAESLAKEVGRNGEPGPRVSTPMWAIGSSDQHSILQQVMEGTKDKFVVFFRFGSAEKKMYVLRSPQFKETAELKNKSMGDLLAAEAWATEEALHKNGVSTLVLQQENLNEYNLGYLFMHFKLVVATLGELLDINAFDQPGVELGKRLAKSKLTEL